MPIDVWLRGPLYEQMRSVLSAENRAVNEYFNVRFLRMAAEEHYQKRRNWGDILWKMIVFSMWHKMFIEMKASSEPKMSIKDLV